MPRHCWHLAASLLLLCHHLQPPHTCIAQADASSLQHTNTSKRLSSTSPPLHRLPGVQWLCISTILLLTTSSCMQGNRLLVPSTPNTKAPAVVFVRRCSSCCCTPPTFVWSVSNKGLTCTRTRHQQPILVLHSTNRRRTI
jgi:hypothetical protein